MSYLSMEIKSAYDKALNTNDFKTFSILSKQYEIPSYVPLMLMMERKTEFAKQWIENKKIKKETLNELLFQAIRYNQLDVVRLTLEKGASVNHDHGKNLCIACLHSNTEIIKCLLEFGASVRTENKHGGTPLMFATNAKRKDVVKLFIEQDADINKVSKNGKTVFHYMINYNNIEMVSWYLEEFTDIMEEKYVKELKNNRLKYPRLKSRDSSALRA